MYPHNSPSADNLLLGKGQLLFDRFDANGVSTGFRHLGNCEMAEITTADDKIQKYSSMTAAAPLLKEVTRRRTVTLRVTGDEFHPENLALMQQGAQATLVQPATAVVGEALAAATNPGSFVKLSKLGPYTGLSVKFGVVVGVAGVDFLLINAKAGLIQILPGTALTGAVSADYTPSAYTNVNGPQVISGGTIGNITGRLLFVGDPSSGPAMMVEVWKCSMTPDGALALISDDFATMGMTFTVEEDSAGHPASPYYQTTYLP